MLKNKMDGCVEKSLELALGVQETSEDGAEPRLLNGEKVPQKVRGHSGVSWPGWANHEAWYWNSAFISGLPLCSLALIQISGKTKVRKWVHEAGR